MKVDDKSRHIMSMHRLQVITDIPQGMNRIFYRYALEHSKIYTWSTLDSYSFLLDICRLWYRTSERYFCQVERHQGHYSSWSHWFSHQAAQHGRNPKRSGWTRLRKWQTQEFLPRCCYWIKRTVLERRFQAVEFAKSLEKWEVICENEKRCFGSFGTD